MNTRDMTTGSPLGHLVRFALPLLVGNLFQQIYTLADTMIAGHFLGESAIAAIGASAPLYSLILNFAWGLNGGYAIVVTQRFGAQQPQAFRRATAGMFFLNLVGGGLLTALALACLNPMLGFLDTPPEIFVQAKAYIGVICGGMLTTLAYNMLASWLRAIGNSRTPLYFLVLSCLLNVGLDLVFVVVLKAGVAGAAFATVVAQGVSALLCWVYLWKQYRPLLPEKKDCAPDWPLYGELLSTGIAMALMQCIFAIGSVILQRAINGLGQTIITAHTAARRLVELLMMPLSTVATAASTYVSQNYGAGRMDRIRQGMRLSMVLGLGWCLVAGVGVFAFGRLVVAVTIGTSDPVILDNAVMNLRINALCYPALGVLLCLRMSMQSMGWRIAPLLSSSLELLIKLVSSLWFIPTLGYGCASVTEPATWIACAALLAGIYFAKRTPAKSPLAPVREG